MNDLSNIPVRFIAETEDERCERLLEEQWEVAREECRDEFTEWQRADYDRREFEDFSNWLVNKASWNRPNKYEAALTWGERKRVGRGL